MIGVISRPDTRQKLEILSKDAQYDLACACGSNDDERRKRGEDGKWIYPVTLPNGGTSVLFKTLMSNVCSNDCRYCPLREGENIHRCSLQPEETVKVFLDYVNSRKVFGLFLSSGVIGSADNTMEQLNTVARLLRNKYKYRGYIHLKVIPAASEAAIEEALSLASSVSLNIETPGEVNLAKLSTKKNYIRDIIEPIKLISKLTARGTRYESVKQTTQFIVGAAGEKDSEIVRYMGRLYSRLRLHRIYFSSYQKDLGDNSIATEKNDRIKENVFVREHRIYQVDFLLRRYGFKESDIIFDAQGNLSLTADPKEVWAKNHPQFFPVNVNHSSYYELLRVPGLGPLTVKRILSMRKNSRLRSIDDVGKTGRRLEKTGQYLAF